MYTISHGDLKVRGGFREYCRVPTSACKKGLHGGGIRESPDSIINATVVRGSGATTDGSRPVANVKNNNSDRKTRNVHVNRN